METNNGQESYDRLNQEAVDAEEQRYKEWRARVLGQMAAEMGL
jgi:hypothetical protein